MVAMAAVQQQEPQVAQTQATVAVGVVQAVVL
jgi:hypothetical protein